MILVMIRILLLLGLFAFVTSSGCRNECQTLTVDCDGKYPECTVTIQITRFLKNSNSQRCGFDRRVQPRVGILIFCNIFATFCKIHVFGHVQNWLQDFQKIPTLRGAVLIDKCNPGWACKFFAIFLQLFRKIHIFGHVQNCPRPPAGKE